MNFNKFTKSDGVRIILVLFVIGLVYFGLGKGIQLEFSRMFFRLPTSPPTFTSTPIPTMSPTATLTTTPAPSSTPEPTLIPKSMFLPGKTVVYWNEFDNTDPLRGDWVFFPNVNVENGLLVIENSKEWDGVYGNQHLDNGQSIIIQFRFDAWSDVHVAVETGEFDTDTYRSWGVGAEAGIFSPVFSEGTIEFENSFTPDDLVLTPGEWYVLVLHIGGDGTPFFARIWELNNTDNSFEFQITMSATWDNQKWLPLILVGPAGRLEVERYEEIK